MNLCIQLFFSELLITRRRKNNREHEHNDDNDNDQDDDAIFRRNKIHSQNIELMINN